MNQAAWPAGLALAVVLSLNAGATGAAGREPLRAADERLLLAGIFTADGVGRRRAEPDDDYARAVGRLRCRQAGEPASTREATAFIVHRPAIEHLNRCRVILSAGHGVQDKRQGQRYESCEFLPGNQRHNRGQLEVVEIGKFWSHYAGMVDLKAPPVRMRDSRARYYADDWAVAIVRSAYDLRSLGGLELEMEQGRDRAQATAGGRTGGALLMPAPVTVLTDPESRARTALSPHGELFVAGPCRQIGLPAGSIIAQSLTVAREDLLAHDCDHSSGASGAPLLSSATQPPRVVAINIGDFAVGEEQGSGLHQAEYAVADPDRVVNIGVKLAGQLQIEAAIARAEQRCRDQ